MRPMRLAPSTLRSLAAPAVAGPLDVLELPVLVVLLDTVVDGVGVVCEPAPDPVDGPGELPLDDAANVAVEPGCWLELAVVENAELLEVSEAETDEADVGEAGPEVVSDSRGTLEVALPVVDPRLAELPELPELVEPDVLERAVDGDSVPLENTEETDAEELVELDSLERDDAVVENVGVATEAVEPEI